MKRTLTLLGVLTCMPGLATHAAERDTVLGEIVVGNPRERGAKRPFLRNEVAPVESCTIEEALRLGATNLTEAIDKRPGVAVQVECSICNARFISLNNLPGRYTTLLIDGVPLFSAVSQAYGLDSVGLRGLERIDLMRGAGASGLHPGLRPPGSPGLPESGAGQRALGCLRARHLDRPARPEKVLLPRHPALPL